MLSSLSIRPLGTRHSLLATPACSQGLWIGHFGSSSVRINPKKAVGLVEALHGKPPGAPYRVGWAHQQAGLPLEEQRRGQRVSRPLEAGTVLSRNSLPSSCTLLRLGWSGGELEQHSERDNSAGCSLALGQELLGNAEPSAVGNQTTGKFQLSTLLERAVMWVMQKSR